jgi:hypothetical protein
LALIESLPDVILHHCLSTFSISFA